MISFHCEISSQAMEIINKIECHNCARIIEEDEVSDYFDGEGFSDVDQAIQDCEAPFAPDLGIESGR